MAIKEFVVGPQSYFEGNYFSGDYTVSNVSRARLECDIDNIKGGIFITGEYYTDNYIDGTYYHANKIEFQLSADAMVVQEATVGLGGYTAEGYYADSYYEQRGSRFALTAELERFGAIIEAEAVLSTEFAQVSDNIRVRDAASTHSAEFTQTQEIIRIVQGSCDFESLFAPSMTADVIKNTFAVLDSTAALAVVANANRSAQIALSSIINQSAQGMRTRDYVANLSSEFALEESSINFNNATADLSIEFTTTADIQVSRLFNATISSEFAVTIDSVLIKTTEVALQNTFTQTGNANVTKVSQALLPSTFSQITNADEVDADNFFINSLYSSGSNFSANASAKDLVGNVYVLMAAGNDTIIAKFNPRGKLLSQTVLDTPTILTNSKLQIVNDDLYGFINYSETIPSYVQPSVNLNITRSKLFKFNTINNTITWTRTTNSRNLTGTSNGHYYSGSGSCTYTGGTFEDYYTITDFDVYNNDIYLIGYTRYRYYDTVINTLTYDAYRRIQSRVNSSGTELWSKQYDWSQQSSSCPPRPSSVIETLSAKHIPKIEATAAGLYVHGAFSNNNIFDNIRTGTVQTDLSGVSQFLYRAYTTNLTVIPQDSVVDSQGNIVIVDDNEIDDLVYVTKINTGGTKLWGIQLSVPNLTTYSRNICIDQDDAVYVNYRTSAEGDYIVKVNGDGTIAWSRRLYGSTTLTVTRLETRDNFLNITANWNNRAVILQFQTDGSDENITRIVPVFSNATINWTAATVTSTNNLLTASRTSYTENNNANVRVRSINLFNPQAQDLVASSGNASVANIMVLVNAEAEISANYNLNAVNTRLRKGQALLSSTVNGDIAAVKIATITAQLLSTASVIPNGGYIRGITDTLLAQATVSVQYTRIQQFASDLIVTAEIVAEPRRLRGHSVEINSTYSLTLDYGVIKSTAAEFTAFNTQVSAVNKIGRGLIQLDAVATQTTDAVKTVSANSVHSVESQQSTNAVKTVVVNASIDASTQLDIVFVKIPASPVNMESEFTASVTTNNSKITRITATADSTVTATITAVKTATSENNLTAQSTLTFGNQVTRLRLADSSQQLQATILAPAVKTAVSTAEFTAFNTVLAVGTKIAFDPDLQLIVPAEYRTVQVQEENRLLTVPEETRVNMVRMTL